MRAQTVSLLVRSAALTALLSFFSAAPMFASCGEPIPPTSPPPGSPPAGCPCYCTGSPCYVASGTYVTQATDLAIRTNGFSLTAGRNYLHTQAVDGPLGFGWLPSTISRLYYTVYLYSPPSTYQKVADVILPDGSRLVYTDNGNGTFTPPAGRNDTLVGNMDGTYDLTIQRTRSKLHFGTDGSLLSQTDDYGNVINFTYDGSGRVQQVADASGSGRYLNVYWGADGRISSIKDSSSRQVQYSYNGQGGLSTVTNPLGEVTTYSYVQGRFAPLLSRITDNWGRDVTDITYDTVDRVSSYTENGETYTYTYAYHGDPSVTAKVDSQGNLYTYRFSSVGYVTDRTPPSGGGGPTHTDYNSDGTVQQTIDAVSVKTYYTYTADASPLTVTRDYHGPNAVRFDYAYDANFPDKVISITPKNPNTGLVDPTWQAWKYDYYRANDPAPSALHHVYRVESDGVTLDTMATYVYDTHGRVTRQTSATGGVTDYVYDLSYGNLYTVTAPANNDSQTRPVTTYGYDSLGRVTSVTDPLGHVTTTIYDAIDRVTSVTLPKPSPSSNLIFTTTYSYDNYDSGTGLLFVNVTDPNGQTTRQGYDQYGRLVKSIDALANATTYGYTRGLLTSITDANGNATSYGYDPGRRLSSTTFPDSAVERYTYNQDSQLYQKTDRKNQTTTYAYDNLKRLASKTYPNSSSIAYTYQGQMLTQVVDTSVSPTETHTFGYDSSYRVQTETQATRGTITHVYNAGDTIARYAVQSGPTATYTYYPDGSLDTIAWSPVAGSFKYTYALTGQYQTITFPNNQTRNSTYDDQGRLTQLSNLFQSTNLATYAYGYDLNYTTGQYTMLGQRVSTTATVPSQSLNNHLFKYEYDSDHQLNKTTYPNVPPFNAEVDSWTYDAIGNRLTNTVNGNQQNYTYQRIGSNNWQRLLSDGVNSYTYDANGNTATRTGYAFGSDYDNRLTSISGGATASYSYDYQGRRSDKTLGSASPYLYNGLNLIQEQGATPADYLFGPGIDEPLAMNRGGQIYYYETDALGSVATITNSSGTVQSSYLYDVWGQTRRLTGSLANAFTYTGREIGEAALNFYRARYLSTGIGRFTQEDPKGFRGGDTNFYAYVSGGPVKFRDPLGHTRVYGNWCGPNWTGGLQEQYDPMHDAPGAGGGYKAPIDGIDTACMNHDKCYFHCREDHPCSGPGRQSCQMLCNWILQAQLGDLPKGGGIVGFTIAFFMEFPPQPEPNGGPYGYTACPCPAPDPPAPVTFLGP